MVYYGEEEQKVAEMDRVVAEMERQYGADYVQEVFTGMEPQRLTQILEGVRKHQQKDQG